MNHKNHSSDNIPKLRFPEFSDSWEVKKLGDIILKLSSGVSVNSIDEPIKETGEYGILKTSCISSGKFYPTQNKKIVPNEVSKAKLNPLADTILISRMNTPQLVGESGYIDNDYPNLFIPDRLWMTEIGIQNNAKFLSILLSSSNMMEKISNIASGTSGSMKNISKPNFLDIECTFPTLPEQQKIATFLSTVDEKLQALKKKKSLLEIYKKGVMQKLFSQERNAARIRFKDDEGDDFEDWEVRKLGEISEKKSSNISANKIEDNFGEYIIYGASGILKKVDFYKEENDYVSIIKDGAGVGRIVYCKGKSSVLGTMEMIKSRIELNTYFLYCLLENIDFTKYITGSTIPHIYFKDYKNEICEIPCIEEQTKISNFLMAIDEKINNVDAQIKQTELWKKGLLQQMFV
ncbi:MAG: restriction endonuclease subunit S [Arcicella sp.]|nr:restriction endonuclease subunit S [Arcicella sp.]